MSIAIETAPAVKTSRKPITVELLLTINGQSYDVSPMAHAPGEVKSYRLAKQGAADSVYDVCQTAEGLVTCDCPSYQKTYRGNGLETCKHGRALIMVGLVDYPTIQERPEEAAPARVLLPDEFDEPKAPEPVPVAPAFDREPYRAQNAVAEGRAFWLAHRHMHTSEPMPASCCDPSESMPCQACVTHDGPADLSDDGWDDDHIWTTSDFAPDPDDEPEPDQEVLDLIESGAAEEAYGEAPLGFATPEVFRAVAEGRAEFAREFGYVPSPGFVTRENAEELVIDEAFGDGLAEPIDRARADAMRARRLAGPPAPSPEPDLADQVDVEARHYRTLGTAFGDLMAETIERLARQVRMLDADDPATYRDRLAVMLDGVSASAESRMTAVIL